MRKPHAWLAFLILLLLAVPASAQRTGARIRGSVADSSGAVIPGATVTLNNSATGLSRTTTTNENGLYSFGELPVGTYSIKVELQGFKTGERTDVQLNVADDRAVDFALDPGQVQETVSVEASAVQVKTIGGDVSGVVTGQQVRELPLNGRNFLQLATLMPGVSAPDFLNVKDKGLLGGSDLAVSGGAVTANLWTVDGANNNDVGSNRTILVYPSVDAIEEFKILRNSYGPEYGQSGGAQINIVTRSGNNQFQGSALYFVRNDALNASNYFLKIADQPKEQLSRHDFGGTFGGPIIKDKLHFFGSLEWNREQRGSVRNSFVPTDAEKSGDFSGAPIAGCSQDAPIDPLTGAAFPGNKIPADRLSPAGLLFLKLYPSPNTTPTAGSCNNWVTSLTTPINWRQENLRVDYNMSKNLRAMVRYTQDAWENNSPSLQSNLWGDDPFPAVDSNWNQPGRSFIAQLNQTIGSSATNSLQFSYSGNSITVTRGGTDPGLNDEINAAIPTLFSDAGREYPTDRGHPVFWGGAGYDTLWNEAPFHNNQDLFVLKDDYSAVFGKHLLKVGGLMSFNRKNEDVGGYGSYENSEFWGSTGLGDTGVTSGNLLADFLLKDMQWGFDEFSAQRQVPQRWRDAEFYVSDSWKIAPHVTLDYGVRYSLFLNPYAADDRIMSFDPASFNPALGNDPCNGLLQPPGTTWCQDAGFSGATAGPNRSLYDQDKNNFAPRVGLAWDVFGDGKTALRLGAGQFFLRERLSPGLNIGANPPFVVTKSGSRTLDSAAEPCDGCFSDSLGAPSSGREVKGLTPNNWQWNLTVQREIHKNTTVELSYVGNKGNHLLKTYDVNQVRSGDNNGDGVSDRLEYARGDPDDPDALGALRPYSVFGDHRIGLWDHSGTSIYHALQSQLISRFGHGSQVQASYTWSRTISNIALDNSDGGLNASDATLDVDNPGLDRGLARTHREHIFNTALVLLLPTLDDHSGFVHHVFGDWEIATIAEAASGSPLTITTGTIPGLAGGPSGTGYTDNQRPNRVAGQPCRASSGPAEQWLNPNAYTLDNFQLGTIGDAGRGDCNGPGVFTVDLSFYKNIRLSDRVKLQFRFEVFNVFNRTNFTDVDATMSPSDVTFDTGDPRTANTITGATIPIGFGQATQARDPRQAQVGFKIMF